jgi:transcriptional regulator with XRE-family HTH domain
MELPLQQPVPVHVHIMAALPDGFMTKDIEIGNRIKEFALANFDSLTEFSCEMGMQLQAIYPYINGTSLPGTKILLRMQKIGCSIDWLLSGEKSKSEITIENIKKIIED